MDEVKPILKQCQKDLDEYKIDNENGKRILQRFDEVILEKASKFNVDQLEEKLQTYCLKTEFIELQSKVNKSAEESKSYIQQVQDLCDSSVSTVYANMIQLLKEMEVELRHKIQSFLELNTIKPDELHKLLKAKADISDINLLDASKVDKKDYVDVSFERKIRGKQFEHILIIVIEMIRNNIKTVGKIDDVISGKLKCMSLYITSCFIDILKQALTVYYWITGGK